MPQRRASSWLGALVSVVSLAAVGWWISRQGAPRLPDSEGGFAWLGAACSVIALNFGVRGWRWHRILRSAGVPHRQRDAVALTVVGYGGLRSHTPEGEHDPMKVADQQIGVQQVEPA